MAELTTAVSDEEVVKHFREVKALYVIEIQLTGALESSISISPTSSQSFVGGGKGRSQFLSSEDFLDKFTDILERAMQGLMKKEVDIISKKQLCKVLMLYYFFKTPKKVENPRKRNK